MSRIIFFSLPHLGHVNPSINLLKDYLLEGHNIQVFTSEDYRKIYENIGCDVIIYKVDIQSKMFNQNIKIKEKNTLYENIEEMFKSAIADIELSRIILEKHKSLLNPENIDVIIYDSYAIWGSVLSRNLNIKSICIECFFVYNSTIFERSLKEFILFNETRCNDLMSYEIKAREVIYKIKQYNKRLSRKLGIENYNVFDNCYSENLNMVMIGRSFQPYCDSLDDKFVFFESLEYTSQSINNTKNDDNVEKDEKEIIYVTHGREKGENSIAFFKAIMNCLKSYKIIISSLECEELKNLRPKNCDIEIHSHVEQIKVLKDCDYFITHGGVTGIKEAIMLEKPMILYPTTFSQYIIANQAEKLKIGIVLKKYPIDEEELKKSITKLKNDSCFKENLNLMKRKSLESNAHTKIRNITNI